MRALGSVVAEKYQIEKILGEGGMGAVYAARHLSIGKRVAIKFLLPQYAENSMVLARFQQEAQATAAVGHRGIVDIYDMGIEPDGSPYLIMELLAGQSLGALLLKRQYLDVQTTAYIGCTVLSALSAAHAINIVHRDIKPDNIFLVETGARLPDIKLLDFGISRFRGAPGGTPRALTQVGSILGTPFFMSPEQAMGEDVDHRTDIYAMGVILFQALTGKLPFNAGNHNALVLSIVSRPPPSPRQFRPDLPLELEKLILCALSKNRDHRYQNVADMFRDLLPFVDQRAVDRLPLPRTSPTDPEADLGADAASQPELPSTLLTPSNRVAALVDSSGPSGSRPTPVSLSSATGSASKATNKLAKSVFISLSLVIFLGLVGGVIAWGWNQALVGGTKTPGADAGTTPTASPQVESEPSLEVQNAIILGPTEAPQKVNETPPEQEPAEGQQPVQGQRSTHQKRSKQPSRHRRRQTNQPRTHPNTRSPSIPRPVKRPTGYGRELLDDNSGYGRELL